MILILIQKKPSNSSDGFQYFHHSISLHLRLTVESLRPEIFNF